MKNPSKAFYFLLGAIVISNFFLVVIGYTQSDSIVVESVRRQRLWSRFSSGLRECFCSS